MKVLLMFLAAVVASAVSDFVPTAPYNVAQQTSAKFATRIANGHTAAANQFPYQVSITIPLGNNVYGVGGGAVISSSWVITAAHVTQGPQAIVRFGSLHLWSGGVSQICFQFYLHPDPNQDVSLVRLPSPVGFSNAIQPIRLPSAGQVANTFTGYQATVSGWGGSAPSEGVDTSFLRWVSMRVLSNADCGKIYGPIAGHIVCAVGYVNPGNQGPCGGDSGGPLTINEGGTVNTLIGIVNFGPSDGCHLGLPTGYFRTTTIIGWVAGITGIPVRS